jgi:C4-dicarboxylate-specific signal transduction histidine kinase
LALDFVHRQSEDREMKTWKRTIVAGVLASLTIFSSLSAWAGSHNSYVDQRQRNQQQRIQQAWQSGRLTPRDYQRLQNQLQQIRMIEHHMRRDGRLDPAEKTRINEMLNHTEREINRSIHYHRRIGWHH